MEADGDGFGEEIGVWGGRGKFFEVKGVGGPGLEVWGGLDLVLERTWGEEAAVAEGEVAEGVEWIDFDGGDGETGEGRAEGIEIEGVFEEIGDTVVGEVTEWAVLA